MYIGSSQADARSRVQRVWYVATIIIPLMNFYSFFSVTQGGDWGFLVSIISSGNDNFLGLMYPG